MAASASFEEFYVATVDRLLGHLFLVTGDLHAAACPPSGPGPTRASSVTRVWPVSVP
jgi:hypothetical protein